MKILLLASEPKPHAELASWLRAGSYEFRTAAPVALDPWRPDLIVLWLARLLDPALQHCMGLRRQAFSDGVRVLALGSWHGEDEIRQVLEAGADDYLPWPTDTDQFRLRLMVLEMDRSRYPLGEHEVRLQARVADTQKAESLATLAGTVAHDFNNLLSAILGNAELAMIDASTQSDVKYSLEQIERASRRAAELIRQMLTYSTRGTHTYVPLNLTQLVEEMTELLRISISKLCRVDYSFGRGLPPVKGEPAQLRQVVMNLLLNAGEATADSGGTVKVQTRLVEVLEGAVTGVGGKTALPPGSYVSLLVSDDGTGMDGETRERIFDPFFSTKKTGRGLGLAAVLGIVRAHGGALQLQSQLGQGSQFEVLLPALEIGETTASGQNGGMEDWKGSGTVLLVDDEDAVREAGRRLLEKAGYTVLAACTGEQGLEVFRDFSDELSAVILDLSMPGMDGIELFRTIHQSKPDLRVIVWSGFDEEDIAGRLAEIGECEFIEKPSHVREPALALKHALQP